MTNAHRILTLVLLSLLLTAAADAQDKEPLPITPEYHQLVKDVNYNVNTRSIYERVRLPTAEETKQLGELWPTIPADDNAAFMYARAFAWLKYPATVPPGSAFSKQPYDGNIVPLRAYVTDQKNALDAAGIAVSRNAYSFPPVVAESGGQKGQLCVPLAQFRRLALTIGDAGFVAEVDGRFEEAASSRISHTERTLRGIRLAYVHA